MFELLLSRRYPQASSFSQRRSERDNTNGLVLARDGALTQVGAPAICIFWCAVALGGLSRGQPVQLVGFDAPLSLVRRYCRERSFVDSICLHLRSSSPVSLAAFLLNRIVSVSRAAHSHHARLMNQCRRPFLAHDTSFTAYL